MFFRIQSLFLTIASGLLLSMFIFPLISITDGNLVTNIRCFERWDLLLFNLVTFVLSVAVIFYYKKRIFQLRVCILNSLLLAGYQILLLVLFFQRDPSMSYSIIAVFPIVAAILNLMSARFIGRDEAMLIAATRLRSYNNKKGKKRLK